MTKQTPDLPSEYVVEFNDETQGYNVCERAGGPVTAAINALDYELSQQRAIADQFAASPALLEALKAICEELALGNTTEAEQIARFAGREALTLAEPQS